MTKKWHIIDLGNGEKDLPEASCEVMTVHYNYRSDYIYSISTDRYSAKWKQFNAWDATEPKKGNEDYNAAIIAWCYTEIEEAEIWTEIGAEKRAQIRADYLAAQREKEAKKVEFLTADEPETDDGD